MSAAQLQSYLTSQPITITSEYAEIIYFLRNGNLYRRVLLVTPERGKSLAASGGNLNQGSVYQNVSIFGPSLNLSWQGLNDISCRPGGASASGILPTIPNDLGDLTNRQNRAFRPRFSNEVRRVSCDTWTARGRCSSTPWRRA